MELRVETKDNVFRADLSEAGFQWEIGSDVFNLSEVEGEFSVPGKLPTSKKNSRFFAYLQEPQNRRHFFGPFKSDLFYRGLLLRSGLYSVQSANKNYFSGTLKSKTSDWSELKKQSIRDLVGDERHFFGGMNVTELNNYTDQNSDIVFPEMMFGDKIANQYNNGYKWMPYGKWQVMSDNFVPCFKISYIFKLIMAKAGYRLTNSFADLSADLSKLITISSRALILTKDTNYIEGDPSDTNDPGTTWYTYNLPESFRIADHLPDINFKDFLESLRKLAGFYPHPDSVRKEVTLVSYNEILESREYRDWTGKTEPNPEITPVEYEGFTFDFGHYSDYKDEADTTDGFQKRTALPLAENELMRVNTINMFYTALRRDGKEQLRLAEYSPDRFSYKKDEGGKKIETKFSPVAMSFDQLMKNRDTSPVVRYTDSSEGTVMSYATIQHNWFLTDNLPIQYVQLMNSSVYPTGKFYDVFESLSDHVALNLPYIEDDDEVTWRFKLRTERMRPTFDNDLSNPDTSGIAKIDPFLAFWHGLQPSAGGENYPLASSANYNAQGTKIGDLSLRWDGADGLVNQRWSRYLSFLKNTVRVKHKIRLNLTDIKFFKPWRKVLIRNTLYFVEHISVAFTKQGLLPAEVSLLKMGAAICKHKIVTEIYRDCKQNITTIIYHDDNENPAT